MTDLQEKARKEGILKNDSDDAKRMSEDNNFLVRNFSFFSFGTMLKECFADISVSRPDFFLLELTLEMTKSARYILNNVPFSNNSNVDKSLPKYDNYVKYEKSREDLLNAMSGRDAWNKIIVQSIPTEC